LIGTGGWMLAMKGESAAEELSRDRQALTSAGLIDAEVTTAGAGVVDPQTVVVRARRTADPTKSAGRSRKPSKPARDSRGMRRGRRESR